MVGAIYQAVIGFIMEHEGWAAPLVLLISFGESLALISAVFPGTTILVGVGALAGATGLPFWPLWTAAVAGAVIGDLGSYWLGRILERSVSGIWPISRSPEMLADGATLFRRWGVLSVPVGRMFGPLRAVVPVVAGICGMPFWGFVLADFVAAVVWATAVLAPGAAGVRWLMS